jgi:arylformamidase
MLVFNQYSQAQLDLQYNVRHHVPDFLHYLTSWETRSRITEQRRRIIKNVLYGELDREYIDAFPSETANAKTLIFIHGGYWRTFDTSLFYFIADAFGDYGITTVLINYPLAPNASMDQIVVSCHRAMAWLTDNLRKLNGDPEKCYVVGYSAGAHLAAMMGAAAKNHDHLNLADNLCLISGLFDLIPLQLSYLNESLQMDSLIAERNSPVLQAPDPKVTALIAVGTEETEEFRRQSMTLHSRWQGVARSVDLLTIPHLNHFSILDSLTDKNSMLHLAICRLMGLTSLH